MTTREFLLSGWSWHWLPIVACAAIIATYAIRFRSQLYRAGLLLVGLAFFLVALVSPVNTLADGYLFSAHMLQHLLLLMVVPLFLLLSLPMAKGVKVNHRAMTTLPALAWLAGVGAMWLWHAPTLCNAATSNPTIRGIQTVSLLVMGSMFWWPIAGPFRQQRLSPLAGMTYLFSACVGCTLLGILITFTPLSVCSIYLHPVDRLGILPLLRNGWGMTSKVDQQVGGLLMWVPACLIYLASIMGLLARWYRDPETETLPASKSTAPSFSTVNPNVRRTIT
jgi:cytochrome c oxidase assembly factor CtaG